MNGVIPFIMASDENYIEYSSVLINSILLNCNKNCTYKCIFFHKDVSGFFINKLKSFEKRYSNFKIEFYSNDFTDDMNDFGTYSLSAFDRLYIPNIFVNYDKIIYLDCDMLALDDISKLYNEDIEDYHAAVCMCYGLEQLVKDKSNGFLDRNPKYKNINWEVYVQNIFKIKDSHKLFNSGMMLINLKKFKEDGIGEKCIKDLSENKYVLPDQDALNKHLQDRVKYISNRWNLSVGTLTFNDDLKHNLIEASKEPGILHYEPFYNQDLLYTDNWFENYLMTDFAPFKNYKVNSNVISDVVKKDMCIGCGVCANVCPQNCLEIKLNNYKEYKPTFNKNKCINCGICLKYCPHSLLNRIKEHFKVKNNPKYYGIENASYYLSWDKIDKDRIKSASGGVVTSLAKYLLSNNFVDGVIHGEMIENNKKDIHYKACISYTLEELEQRRSSFYFAFTFDNILKEIDGKTNNYLLIAVPCVIRAIKKLCHENKKYQGIKLYTIALVCSHNVNGAFTDYLADSLKIDKKQKYRVNLRYKDDTMLDANNYINSFFGENFFIKKNRFESIFTDTWRAYYFAMNSCNYCSDFWGEKADISVKDAWGKWANEDKLNKSIVVVRNNFFQSLIEENKPNLNYEVLDKETVATCQLATVSYKQVEAENKLFKSIFDKSNSLLLKNTLILKLSKKMYPLLGFKISYFILKKINKLTERKLS